MRIGVIIAMDIEYRQMHDALGGDTGRLGNNEIILWQCGIGKVNAAVGTMRLIQEHHPDAIISTGLAGGIKRFPGFEKYAKGHRISARNAFTKHVLKDGSITVVKTGDEYQSTIDWGAVAISKGTAQPPLFEAPSFEEEATVKVSWTPEGNNADIVQVLVYQPDTNKGFYSTPTSMGAGSLSVVVPARWSGMDVHVYGFCLRETESGQAVTYSSYWDAGNVEAMAEVKRLAGAMDPSVSTYIGHGSIA